MPKLLSISSINGIINKIFQSEDSLNNYTLSYLLSIIQVYDANQIQRSLWGYFDTNPSNGELTVASPYSSDKELLITIVQSVTGMPIKIVVSDI